MTLPWTSAIGLVLIALAGASIAEGQQTEKVPKDIQHAEKTLTKWLNGLKGKTPEEIRKALGDPSKETTWLFKAEKQMLLKYKIGDSAELSLSFYEGRVIVADLHLMPRSTP